MADPYCVTIPLVDPPYHYAFPEKAFVGPSCLEGTIALETAIDNPAVVDQVELLGAWDDLSAFSVEAHLVGRPDIFSFANNHCLLFAAIRSPIRVVVPGSPDIAIGKLGLPANDAVFWVDSPVVPPDADEIYAMVKEFHELDQSIHSASSSSSSIPINTGRSLSNSKKTPSGSGVETLIAMEWKTVGFVYVTISTIPREVHVGVALLPVYRGYGGGMKACAFAVQWAVETIQAHRVQARIMSSPHRDRAQRLFTALGFAHEGIQRRAVQDFAGEWADVTHMGMLDTDWVVRRRRRAAPRSMWDELFARHQQEREELIRWDENRERARLQRTSSMETVRMGVELKPDLEPNPEVKADLLESLSDGSSSRASSASPPSSISVSSPRSSSGLKHHAHVPPWRHPPFVLESDSGDLSSDSEWEFGMDNSDESRSSEELLSRPPSAASWSSFESIDSNVTCSSGV